MQYWILLCAAWLFQSYAEGNVIENYHLPQRKCHLSGNSESLICKGITGKTEKIIEDLADQESLHELNTVQRIEFRHGETPTIGKNAFKKLPFITQLTFSNMSLTKIEDDAFEGIKQLKLIDLSFNNLERIKPNLFKWTGVRHIRLDNNPNFAIPTNGPLLNVPKLQWLSLRNCGITYLSNVTFSKTPHLSHLDLSSNHLTQLPDKIFASTTLTHLNLSNNKLKTLSLSVFSTIPGFPHQPRAVIIAGNQLPCDCYFADTVRWLSRDLETHYPTTDPARSRLHVPTTCTNPQQTAVSLNTIDEWNCNEL